MANAENDQADQAAKESLVASLIKALKDNREALRFLPEMMGDFIETQKARTLNVHESGYDDEFKTVLIQRDNKDLQEKVTSLRQEIKVKNERIKAQDQMIKEQKGHIEALSGTFNSKPKGSRSVDVHVQELKVLKDRNDELIRTVNEQAGLLKEKAEEISSLESKLRTAKRDKEEKDETNDGLSRAARDMDERMKEKEEKISLLEHELETKRKEKELKDATNEDLPHEVEIRDRRLKEQAEKFHHLAEQHRAELSDKDEEIKQIQNRMDDLTRGIKAKNDQLKEQAERHELLTRSSKDALATKEREIEQMKNRIASLSEKRVRQDQTKVEDTLSKNRQSTLEVDFKNFFDEARMDACDRIQSFYKSEEEADVRIYYPRLACLIFEAAFERMREARDTFSEICKEVAKGVIQKAPEMIQQFSTYEERNYHFFDVAFRVNLLRQASPQSSDVVDALMLNLKESVHEFNLQLFLKDVQRSVWAKWGADKWCMISPIERLLLDSKIISYINKCMQLAWRMVTQVPAMEIEYQSKQLGDNHNNLGYHSSPAMRSREKLSTVEDTRVEIACYLWPGLFDGSGRIVHKAKVLCKWNY